jgi:hypothetical protein
MFQKRPDPTSPYIAAAVRVIDINTIVSGNAKFGRKISRENKDKYGK